MHTFRSALLAQTLLFFFAFCTDQLIVGQGKQPNAPTGPFDGTYVPDPRASNTSALLGSSQGCPFTDPGVAGRGLIVTNSLATFHVGFEQIGARKVKPSKASGKVAADGKLAISKGMIRIEGRFDGPSNATSGQENAFRGEFIVDFDRHTSCAYSLHLTHAPTSNP